MTALTVVSGREASIFACVCDTVVAPGTHLPQVKDTDAAFAYDRTLAASPQPNRAGIRAMFLALELSPLLLGRRHRLRTLSPEQRTQVLRRLERTPPGAALLKAARGIAHICYYGDKDVMRGLGYDPDAVLARAQRLRAQEARW